MSILDKNITEEEKLSGYSPSEREDETFMLSELDAYPGKLPDFSYEEEPIIPGEGTFLDDDEEEFDSFDDLEDTENQEDESDIDDGFEDTEYNFDDEESEEEVVAGAFEDSDEDLVSDFTEYDDEEGNFDDSDSDDSEDSFNFGDDDGIEELSEDEIRALEGGDFEDETESSEENIDLDDDLKAVLQNDLKKSKERKGDDFNLDDEIEVVSDEEFPIDDEINADVVNFSDIDADKPSNFGIDKLDDELENESKEEKKKAKENKKLSKKMIYIYSGVAVLLLATLLITAIMNKELIFNNIPKDEDSTLVEDKSKKEKINRNNSKSVTTSTKKDNSKSVNKDEKKSTDNFKKVDVSQEEEGNSLDNNTLNSNNLTENSGKIIDDKESETEENVENEKSKKILTESPKLKSGKNTKDLVISDPVAPIKKEVKVDEVKTEEKKTISSQKRNKNKVSKKANSKKESSTNTINTDIASNKTKKDNIFKNESNSVVPYPRKAQSDEGLFIVQVYASQSKEDALSWLEKLKEQDINDAFISEQIIRDEVWYRVRFGSFTNKNDALEKAAKLGYAQTWVDRVK